MRISIWGLIGSLFLLAFLALYLWNYSQTEYIEKEIDTGFQGVAARNPLFAVGRLAEHYGADVRYVPTYSKPPWSTATMVLTAPRDRLSPGQNEALLDWVTTTGGHLVIPPQYFRDHRYSPRARRRNDENRDAFRDSLLDSLNVSVRYLPASTDEEQPSESRELSDEPEDRNEMFETALDPLRQTSKSKQKIQTVKLPDGTHLKAGFDPRLRLVDLGRDSDWRISDSAPDVDKNHEDKGSYGLSYVLGKGRITVLANLDFIDNHTIGEADHAALFVYLVSLEKNQNIWFVYGSDVPSLWRWLIDYAWAVFIAAALLLIVWLWMISRRFGPLLPTRFTSRRSIVEHVAASARYLWRAKQGRILYRMLCDDFYKRAYLRHPQWSQLSKQELNQEIVLFAHKTRIPHLSGLTEQAVEHLLDTSHSRDENQFAANSLLLDILRNKL